MTLLPWVTGVTGLSLLCWLWLACCQGLFWRTDLRLPPNRPEPVLPQPPAGGTPMPEVAIVVPARDEAAVLPLSLPGLLAQKYPGRARVILVDDHSSDGTAAVARALAEQCPEGLPLTVTTPPALPPGWTGKLWAVRHGVELAGEVEWLLLTDADIAHGPQTLAALVAGAQGPGLCPGSAAERLDLVSQMARLRTETRWERLIVPAFVYFFAQLYPFRWSNRPGSRTAAAAGGCSLVRREALERAGGVAAIRGAVIDDVSLARAVKRTGGRTWLGLAERPEELRVLSVRPYPGLGPLWRMVSRSAYAQLRHSPPLLLGTVIALALIYLVPPVATGAGLLTGDLALLVTGATAWLVMTGTYLPMIRYYDRPAPAALLLPFTALLYLLMTVDSAVQHYRGRGAAWKGRTY
ncbi:glycosyltransferase [Kitasatospora kifunensis]|uniref:Hopene-associated glycosyltransferase HpnB n=1 Tax=Kitasatospora kifunensis TaxID=58351 RepID=A0A7W7QXS8_KITKI|nr:glycosyltransferase [Kitasatospora kifunensis]MBB4921786.1 hopene-associated glycosyltransferase HpnB [Kitasatospora kifunensis]